MTAPPKLQPRSKRGEGRFAFFSFRLFTPMTTTRKIYSADEMKEDAASRIEDTDELVMSYTYPVGTIWEGTERERVVTADVTAEVTISYDPFRAKHVTSGARAFFEDSTTDPPAAFTDGEHEDSGPAWMHEAVRLAGEVGPGSTDSLLSESGIEYDVVELGGDLHFYFDEEAARRPVLRTLHGYVADYYPVRFDLTTREGREGFREWLRPVLSQSVATWDAPAQMWSLPFEEYFKAELDTGAGFLYNSGERAGDPIVWTAGGRAASIYEEVREEVLGERWVDAAERALSEALPYEFQATNQTRGGMETQFERDGWRWMSIPGEHERLKAGSVQLIPPTDTDLSQVKPEEHGYFGHDVEVLGETFQVNWLQ